MLHFILNLVGFHYITDVNCTKCQSFNTKYLSDTLQSYQSQHRYSTRTAANPVQLKYPTANKEPYRKSFFISSIQSWNKLSSSITNSPSLSYFKMRLKENSNTTQPLFNHNMPRNAEIIIVQLRIGFNDLNSQECSESPKCSCGHRCENICHFIWYCPIYKELRQSLLAELHKLYLSVPGNSDLLL